MLIRTFHKQKNIKKIIFIMIWIIAWIFLIFKLANIIYTKYTNQSISTENWSIWEKIKILWSIETENKFPLYTHKIWDTKWKSIFLKSNTINLNKFDWEKEILWLVLEFYKWSPIVQVDTIKIPDQNLIIKNNTYFFVNDLFYLDFSNQNQLSAQKTKDIEILLDWEKIFSVERFLCSKVLKNKNCNYLIDDYDQTQKENFDSLRWYTFYKHGTWLRTIFDWDMFGYIFKNVEESVILDISSMIRIVDKNFISTNKSEQIKEVCKTEEKQLKQIIFSKIDYENNKNLITLIIDWSAENKKSISCEITFDMRNERKITETKIK